MSDSEEKIERGLRQIRTRADARRALEEAARAAGELDEGDVAANPSAVPHPRDPSARALVETAEDVALACEAEGEEVDEGIAAAAHDKSSSVERGRSLLREELIHRLGPLDRADTVAFLAVNGLPHPPAADVTFKGLSFVMTGGHAWALVPLATLLWDRARGKRALAGTMPALWLSTFVVEHAMKRVVRRRRPFLSLVDSIIVGRKPGSFSFPSGHSAAAFAGAFLLSQYYPKRKGLLFGLAGLVGFSRVYLGAHYPGDVVSGGVAGMALAGIFRTAGRLFRRRKNS